MKKVYDKYKNAGEEVKASFWYTVCNILIKGLSLVTVPLFTRILTEAEYGTVSVYNGWRDIFLVFGTLNIHFAAFNTALVKFKEDIDGFVSSILFLIDIIVVGMMAVYFCNVGWWNGVLDLNWEIMLIVFAVLITTPAYQIWMTKQRFIFKYKKVVAVTLGVSFVAPLLSLILIYVLNNNANAKIIGTELPILIIGTLLSVYFLKKGKKLFEWTYWRYALTFTVPLIPHYLSGTVLNQSDRIMISKMVSVSKAGIYSVAYSAAFTIGIVSSAINNSMIPWMYQKLEEKDYGAINKRTSQLLTIFSLLLLAFILVVPEALIILAPKSYYEAIYILPVLVMGVYFQFLYGFFGTVEFFFEKTLYAMLASVIAAVSNIILNILFIPSYGYFVAGYTTLISYIIMSVCHYFFMKITLKKKKVFHPVFEGKRLVAISTLFLIIGYAELYLYDYIYIRYCIFIVMAIVLILNRTRLKKFLKI